MIPKECKRLAEVDFPIAVVSKHSAREKSIRHGHPSTLHLWWARRPLAACRAMLMALLLPDPGDAKCPAEFITAARDILLSKHGCPQRWESEVKTTEGLRKTLLEFIGDFANWDNAANEDYLSVARALIKAAHPDETPLVVDPFAGGGSIPLEALRLGCEAFASDLNPVACLILKVMLEDIPRYGQGLADELRRVGKEIREKAEKELSELYPKDSDGAAPIAYLWARTVKCESPNCGAEIPLMRSFWLCKKATRKRALQYRIERSTGKAPCVALEIFEPKADKEVPDGTVTRAKATCLCCGAVLPPERVRAQLSEQRGGADVIFDEKSNRIGGARLLAVVTLHPGMQGRNYRLPTEQDYQAILKAQKCLRAIIDIWEHGGENGPCPVPDEPLPWERQKGNSGFRVLIYGMKTFGDLFTARQKVALVTLGKLTAEAQRHHKKEALAELLSMVGGKSADYNSANCRWVPRGEYVGSTYARQALPIVWDFNEIALFGDEATGGFVGAIDWIARVADNWPSSHPGQVEQADAGASPLPGQSVGVWFTDPPYYDAIAYADLSDFFLVWLKRTLHGHPLLHDLFDPTNPLTPKRQEAIQDPARWVDGESKNRDFYEKAMAGAFSEGRRLLHEDGIGSVVFAHKTTEGWEALLSAMIQGGWTITGSWPITTEMGARLIARDTAALATSVHLVCRPRPDDAPVGDWGEVLQKLPNRVGDWMERLQSEGIRGADLVFACIGPALEIFSRYREVETADGQVVKLATYLEKVWEVVGRTALEQILGTAEARARNGMAGALEEDARLTALFLWTLQSTNGESKSEKGRGKSEDIEEEEEEIEDEDEEAAGGKAKGYSLVFDVVRRFAQPLGIELPKWEARIIETKKGVVRLMAVSERAKQLFGEDGAKAAAEWIERDPFQGMQLALFPEMEREQVPKIHGRGRGRITVTVDPAAINNSAMREATTMDRVHAAMLLQSGGQANALRALISAEQNRSPDFLRLANALSALYPSSSEEKRLLDAMLLAVPR